METISINVYFERTQQFDIHELINVLMKSLSEVDAEIVDIQAIANGGYRFAIKYLSVPLIEFRSVLGCFSSLEEEYPQIKNVYTPMSEIRVGD